MGGFLLHPSGFSLDILRLQLGKALARSGDVPSFWSYGTGSTRNSDRRILPSQYCCVCLVLHVSLSTGKSSLSESLLFDLPDKQHHGVRARQSNVVGRCLLEANDLGSDRTANLAVAA